MKKINKILITGSQILTKNCKSGIYTITSGSILERYDRCGRTHVKKNYRQIKGQYERHFLKFPFFFFFFFFNLYTYQSTVLIFYKITIIRSYSNNSVRIRLEMSENVGYKTNLICFCKTRNLQNRLFTHVVIEN